MVGLFGAEHDPKRPQKTPKDPKRPQNDPKIDFFKLFLYHFWPFWGWFGVILGCFERVLVIFGPETPSNGHIWALKWPKNEPKIDVNQRAPDQHQ